MRLGPALSERVVFDRDVRVDTLPERIVNVADILAAFDDRLRVLAERFLYPDFESDTIAACVAPNDSTDAESTS
jgi:hypothetical protein